MYDDLARTQRLSRLEWVALNVVIPSLTLTRVVQAAHPEFADPVRKALTAAQFQPALFAGTRIEAWVTFSVYFDIYSGSYYEE